MMELDIDGDKVTGLKVVGGCSGNLQGIAKLVEGMEIDEVIKRLEGIRCGFKSTSCPDQIAKALEQYKRAVKRRALGLLCALALLCTLACPAAASASGAAAAEVRERPGLPDVHVYLCSLLSGRAYRHGDAAAYMSLTDIGALYNIDVTVSVTDGGFTASAPRA